jgi:hypothetical protein
MKPEVTFRRIGGRIVPIKLTKSRKEDLKKGLGMVASGAAVAGGAGLAYRHLVKTSLKYAAQGTRAMDSLDRLNSQLPRNLFAFRARTKGAYKIAETMDKSFRAGARFGKFSAPARIGGLLIGSALIGTGLAKVNKALKQKKPSKAEQAAIGATSATAIFLSGAYGTAGARHALKGVYQKAYPIIRSLKTKYRL